MGNNQIVFIPAAVAVVTDEEANRVLLVKRTKPPFQNMWSLPGGKMEANEHASESVLREIDEECGLTCKINNFLGAVSEHVIEDSCFARNHLIHIYELKKISGIEQQNCKWFTLDELYNDKNIPPSDIMIIRKLYVEREANYYNCVLLFSDNKYHLERFETI